ncbi:MAG: inorganic triphosphatase [Betaproteobacteria bacterium HGW-Betaproteobacteria-14]|nr:MAG: inorganic triphosphatase [Betaproteobacteria bacterium HGW-Betaproteobacteria-14]
MRDNATLMAEEIELKLALPASAQRAFQRHPLLKQAERLGARTLVNVYYDTPDLALHRKGVALRTRRQGRAWLQTVKCAGVTAGGLAARPEWEQPYAGRFDFSDVDDPRVRALLERHRLQSHLTPAFETTFTRITWRLVPARGAAVLLMLDRGRIVAGSVEESISEIEIELERGSAAVLFGIAQALAADLPLRPALLSKAERGYRLRLGTPLMPLKASPSPLRSGQAPLEAFRAIANACLAQFQMNELGDMTHDPEFVHQMRVALRRLRSVVRTFRPLLPDGFEATVVPPLRSLARALGQARDWDVLAEEIVGPARSAFSGDARLALLEAAVGRARRQARDNAQRALAAPAQAVFLLDLAARLHAIDGDPVGMDLSAFAVRRLDRLHKKALALAAAAQERDPDSLHALRIGVKRLRYAIEFFAPLYPARETRKAMDTLTGLQDTLGALNDLARAGTLLMHCVNDDRALREAVSLAGGWHGARHAVLRRLTLQGIERLRKSKRFWKEH